MVGVIQKQFEMNLDASDPTKLVQIRSAYTDLCHALHADKLDENLVAAAAALEELLQHETNAATPSHSPPMQAAGDSTAAGAQ
jgi:hypothetical protein